jgi:hypothetical protein
VGLHRRWGAWVAAAGGGLLLGLDALRLAGATPLAAITTALVWLLCHQLGYLWRDGASRSAAAVPSARPDERSAGRADRRRVPDPDITPLGATVTDAGCVRAGMVSGPYLRPDGSQ